MLFSRTWASCTSFVKVSQAVTDCVCPVIVQADACIVVILLQAKRIVDGERVLRVSKLATRITIDVGGRAKIRSGSATV